MGYGFYGSLQVWRKEDSWTHNNILPHCFMFKNVLYQLVIKKIFEAKAPENLDELGAQRDSSYRNTG